jgi:hypothetical protein
MKALFDFFYRHTFLCRILYKRTIAYRKLFPGGKFIDSETPYTDEIALIRKAIKFPSYQLEECDMGIVLSQLIQSDINYSDANKICAIMNRDYENEMHYMYRRNIIKWQLEEFDKNWQAKKIDESVQKQVIAVNIK